MTVEVASNGAEAVGMCLETVFDIVLLDIDMPVLDGIAALHQIRAAEAAAHATPTPVVMVSGRDDNAAQSEAFAAGAQAFLVKPATAAALRERVETLLRSASHPAALGG